MNNVYQTHMQDCMQNVINVKLNGRRLRNVKLNIDISTISAVFEDKESGTIEILLANGHKIEVEFLCDEGFEFFVENLHKYWNSK